MKLSMHEIAVFETRQVSDAMATGFGDATTRQRGWFDRRSGRFLGANRAEAEDVIECERATPADGITWTD